MDEYLAEIYKEFNELYDELVRDAQQIGYTHPDMANIKDVKAALDSFYASLSQKAQKNARKLTLL